MLDSEMTLAEALAESALAKTVASSET